MPSPASKLVDSLTRRSSTRKQKKASAQNDRDILEAVVRPVVEKEVKEVTNEEVIKVGHDFVAPQGEPFLLSFLCKQS